jgi:hypothetical protein
MKSKNWRHCKPSGIEISILLAISISALLINQLGNSTFALKQNNTLSGINFSYPLNSTFILGEPFLVQYDNTTSLKPIGSATLDDFVITFAGNGIINGTIKYDDNGTGVFLTNPNDGTVYQKGIIELRTENGSDSIKTTYESLGIPIRQQNPDRHLLLDSGVMFFNVSSTREGELSFLNNKVGVYKDMIDRDRLNLTTIAWDWN